MYITKETIKHFSEKGISVRYYPEKTFELFRERVYNNAIERYYNYSKDHVAGCEAVLKGTANVVYKSFEDLRNKAIESAKISVLEYGRGLDSYDYDTLYIEYEGRTIVKKINVKSKKIDIEYIEKEIQKSKKLYSGTYGKFADKMQKLLHDNGIDDGMLIYPTTYGIGIWYIYNWNSGENIEFVTDILKRNKIEYSNEFSDARWVYRFKISKKQANIDKIN